VLDGTVIGRCMQRHRHVEFIRFLNTVERQVAADKSIHVVLDNYATDSIPRACPRESGGVGLAGTPSALDFSLHPDLGILTQCGGELLLQDDAAAHPSRRLPLGCRPAGSDQCLSG
jgi:hypothetical protein